MPSEAHLTLCYPDFQKHILTVKHFSGGKKKGFLEGGTAKLSPGGVE